MKVQADRFLEQPRKYNQDQTPLMNQGSGSYENIRQFQQFLERKTGKEMPKSSRSEFLEMFFNKFALSDVEDNTSGPLNSGGIGGIAELPSLKTLLVIYQKSREPSFWEVISDGLFCFKSICKFDRFKNPFATITGLSELYFRFRFILLVQTTKVISMNYDSSISY